jgi:DNA-binding phage protein
MALTQDFKKTVIARVERDPAFAKELLNEATTLLISGEAETARVILRELVNATSVFEQLAKLTDVPSRSLHRMLSPKGSPSMDNLAARLRLGEDTHARRSFCPHRLVLR